MYKRISKHKAYAHLSIRVIDSTKKNSWLACVRSSIPVILASETLAQIVLKPNNVLSCTRERLQTAAAEAVSRDGDINIMITRLLIFSSRVLSVIIMRLLLCIQQCSDSDNKDGTIRCCRVFADGGSVMDVRFVSAGGEYYLEIRINQVTTADENSYRNQKNK